MKTNIFFIFLIFLLVPTISAACSGSNEFASSTNYTVCGLCYSNDTSVPCDSSISCTLDVSYTNGTGIFTNLNMTTVGDGSYTYLFNSTDLTSRSYLGMMYCNNYWADFTISIGSSGGGGGNGGGGGGLSLSQPVVITNQSTSEDVTGSLDSVAKWLGKHVWPTKPIIGFLLIIAFLAILFFIDDIKAFLIYLIRRYKLKNVLKQ